MSAGAELISIGTELLIGRTVNRHAHTLGRALTPLGIQLVRDTTVPDDQGQITSAVQSALERVDLIFISGGLGPTSDDMTRDVLAELLNRRIVRDAKAFVRLKAYYELTGRTVTPQSERQVLVLAGADVLTNSVGLAPGERVDGPNSQILFILPGPPQEFSAILEEHVLPWLRAHRACGKPASERVLMISEIPEAEIARSFEQNEIPGGNVAVAYCAAPGRVEVRFSGDDPGELDANVNRVHQLFGEQIYAEDRVSIEQAIINELARHHLTLSTVEGASDGQLSHRLMRLDESRGWYQGGLVTVRNRTLVNLLGVPSHWIEEHGSVCERVAQRMAAGIRDCLGTEIGLSVTEPACGYGTESNKPDGLLYIGIDDGKESEAFAYRYVGGSSWRAEWVSHIAMERLRQWLKVASSYRAM